MIQTAKKILAHAIKLTKGEAGLLIYDKTTCDIAEAFRTAASELDLSLTMRKIELTGRHGLDPDAETVEMIRNHNVIICPTYYSLTHCAALTEARARGARGATLPGITNSLFMHSFADAAQILRDGTTASNAITGHHEIEVTTDAGTAVTFTVGRSRVEFDTGVLSEPGQIGNIRRRSIHLARPRHNGGHHSSRRLNRKFRRLDTRKRNRLRLHNPHEKRPRRPIQRHSRKSS